MGRSSRKLFNNWEGPRTFFRSPSRHLKESNAKESSFEKPYLTSLYNQMHQEPNLPSVPDGALTGGGIYSSFVDSACSYGIHAVAGSEIPTIGGPEEDKAGWVEPEILLGGIVSWSVSDPGNRRIDIVIDEAYSSHIFRLIFKDGWGYEHSETISITCNQTWSIPKSSGLDFFPGDCIFADGVLHVAGSTTSGRVYYPYYATYDINTQVWTGGVISVESIDRGIAKIALDSNGFAYIIISNNLDGDVKCLDNTIGSWTLTVIEAFTAPCTNYLADVICDDSDVVHVAYASSDGYVLNYANNNGGWSTETVADTTADPGKDYLIPFGMVEDSGTFHIAYYYSDNSKGEIYSKRSYGSSGAWTTEALKTYTGYGCWGSITNVGSDIYYESHYDDGVINFSLYTGGAWTHETVAETAQDSKYLVSADGKRLLIYLKTSKARELFSSEESWFFQEIVTIESSIFATNYDPVSNYIFFLTYHPSVNELFFSYRTFI